MSKLSIYAFVLFPTDISDRTEVSIEHDGGAQVSVNIAQGKQLVRLDYDEAKKIAEYINGMNLKEKSPQGNNEGGKK